MDMKLQPAKNGGFEIVQIKPVVIATFADRDIAMKCMLVLADDECAQDAPVVDAKPKSLPKAIKTKLAPKAKVVPIKETPTAKPKTVVKPATVVADPKSEWLPDELEQAFIRITAGEKIQDVAASYNKNWWQLRAQWANHKRHKAIELRQALTPAEIDDADMDDCRLCGKRFRPSAASLDLCKKCSNDI